MNGYKAFYNNKSIEIYAETLLGAKSVAIKEFKVKKNKEHMISVVLCESNGAQVEHKPDF